MRKRLVKLSGNAQLSQTPVLDDVVDGLQAQLVQFLRRVLQLIDLCRSQAIGGVLLPVMVPIVEGQADGFQLGRLVGAGLHMNALHGAQPPPDRRQDREPKPPRAIAALRSAT